VDGISSIARDEKILWREHDAPKAGGGAEQVHQKLNMYMCGSRRKTKTTEP
jgi:hypothetical protein